MKRERKWWDEEGLHPPKYTTDFQRRFCKIKVQDNLQSMTEIGRIVFSNIWVSWGLLKILI